MSEGENDDVYFEKSDPDTLAVEKLLYDEPSVGAKALQELAQRAIDKADYRSRRNVEQARTTQELLHFKHANPNMLDPDITAAAERRLIEEQANDLKRLGAYDPAKFREANGRDISNQEIMDWHSHYRAIGQPVRRPQQLLDEVATQLETKFNIRRKPSDPSAAVRERQAHYQIMRGKPVPTPDPAQPERAPSYVDDQTIHEATRISMGEGGSDTDSNRSSVVEQMKANRQSLRGFGYASSHADRIRNQT